MIIRSQDKKSIANLENVSEIIIVNNDVYSVNATNHTLLGTYFTEEKAIKVLDMICNFATDKHYEKITLSQCIFIGGVVFDMPQDSEV